MSDNEIRVALAEWLGWAFAPMADAANGVRLFDVTGPNGERYFTKSHIGIDKIIPNYPADLNAMHEAEGRLSHDEWRIFLGFLMGERVIPKLASMEDFHKAWRATARQRAEALLRTIGKWKD